MTTITLNIVEFYNFKAIFKDKFLSKIDHGMVKITASIDKLTAYGYI